MSPVVLKKDITRRITEHAVVKRIRGIGSSRLKKGILGSAVGKRVGHQHLEIGIQLPCLHYGSLRDCPLSDNGQVVFGEIRRRLGTLIKIPPQRKNPGVIGVVFAQHAGVIGLPHRPGIMGICSRSAADMPGVGTVGLGQQRKSRGAWSPARSWEMASHYNSGPRCHNGSRPAPRWRLRRWRRM